MQATHAWKACRLMAGQAMSLSRSVKSAERRLNSDHQERARVCRNCSEEFTPTRFALTRRICPPCQVILSRQRMARRARMRKRSHPRPTVRRWRQARQEALFALCAVCGTKDAHMHVDHIVPAGLLSYLAQLDAKSIHKAMPSAEDRRNLIGICAACHGRKTPAEVALCVGKPMDFWRKLERLDWPMDRVRLALALYGLDAGLGKASF